MSDKSVEWPWDEDLYASVLVAPASPIRMTFQFLPKNDNANATSKGRIGDRDLTNDIILIPRNESLQNDEDPFLSFLATLVPGRPTQQSYDFELVFFDEDNKEEYDEGTPLDELEFTSTVAFRDNFATRFVILDEDLSVSYFEWE